MSANLPAPGSLGPGDEIPPVSHEMGWEQIRKYNRYVTGGKDTKNIHTDDEAARKAGLPRAVATGRHPVSFISEHLIDLFGAGFIAGGEIEVAFISRTIHAKSGYKFHRAVHVGETVHEKVVFKDLYVRREKGWMVCEMTATGKDDGDLIAVYLHTSVLSLTRRHEEKK